MIKNLNEIELNVRIKQMHSKKIFGLILYLSEITIKKWIDNKNFAYLKKELQIYNNVEFGCYKTEGGCKYYFFSQNKGARDRIEKFIAYIVDNNKFVPITRWCLKITGIYT